MVVCVINPPPCLVLPLELPTEGKAEVLGLGVLGFAVAGWEDSNPRPTDYKSGVEPFP